MSPRTSCACSQGTKPPPSPPPPDQRRSLPVSRDGPGSSPSLQRAYAACLLELPPTEALCDGPMMCAGTSPGCGVPPFTPSAAGHKEHPWEAPGGCRRSFGIMPPKLVLDGVVSACSRLRRQRLAYWAAYAAWYCLLFAVWVLCKLSMFEGSSLILCASLRLDRVRGFFGVKVPMAQQLPVRNTFIEVRAPAVIRPRSQTDFAPGPGSPVTKGVGAPVLAAAAAAPAAPPVAPVSACAVSSIETAASRRCSVIRTPDVLFPRTPLGSVSMEPPHGFALPQALDELQRRRTSTLSSEAARVQTSHSTTTRRSSLDMIPSTPDMYYSWPVDMNPAAFMLPSAAPPGQVAAAPAPLSTQCTKPQAQAAQAGAVGASERLSKAPAPLGNPSVTPVSWDTYAAPAPPAPTPLLVQDQKPLHNMPMWPPGHIQSTLLPSRYPMQHPQQVLVLSNFLQEAPPKMDELSAAHADSQLYDSSALQAASGVTTLMLRNIPVTFNREALLADFDVIRRFLLGCFDAFAVSVQSAFGVGLLLAEGQEPQSHPRAQAEWMVLRMEARNVAVIPVLGRTLQGTLADGSLAEIAAALYKVLRVVTGDSWPPNLVSPRHGESTESTGSCTWAASQEADLVSQLLDRMEQTAIKDDLENVKQATSSSQQLPKATGPALARAKSIGGPGPPNHGRAWSQASGAGSTRSRRPQGQEKERTAQSSESEEEDPLRRLSGAKGTMLVERLHVAMEADPAAYANAIGNLAAQVLGEATPNQMTLERYVREELPMGNERSLGFAAWIMVRAVTCMKAGRWENGRLVPALGLAAIEQYRLDGN
ncbi:hypothetical protein AK812_SmicGene24002 [Symbiodinium microadriaticum]|uniref:Uncharacterized protein n=1 Tax=Symbiodinium microadriaticum TaxID=2951 RepID=A0A1Q9DG15_SYMMI|nr:hypothetical protein AK812_SmicGene24002 [Symbiodinium microadriaticum]